VRSLRSRRDRHHKNALCHGWNGLPYSTAGVPAEWSWKRRPTARKSALCLRTFQKIRPASQSRCHPVRSLAEPSPRDLPPDTRRRRHHSSSVMPLGVERSSQPNAVTPGCGRGLSYCNRDNSRSSMTHAAPAVSVLFRLGTLVLMPVKIHPGWAPPDRFLLWRILSLRQLERPVRNIIVLMEIISNLYSHAQPQSRPTQSIRRSG
jgi:hypothetical protein